MVPAILFDLDPVQCDVTAADVITYEMERTMEVQGHKRKPGFGYPPSFVQLPATDITVHEGDRLTLTCIVDGEPKPTGKKKLLLKTIT